MALANRPVKTIHIGEETSAFGTAPSSGNLYGVEAEEFDVPVVSQEFIDVDPVRKYGVNSRAKVLGVQGGTGPSFKLPCDGLTTSGSNGITEVDDGSGNVFSSALTLIKTHHKVIHLASHGEGGRLQGPEAVGTCYDAKGRLCGAATVASEVVSSGIVRQITVDSTGFTQDRFAIGSVLMIENSGQTNRWLVGVTALSTSGSTITMTVVGAPATFGANALIRPTFSVVLPHLGDDTSVAAEIEHYGNDAGACAEGDHWGILGINGNHKLEGSAKGIPYSTFDCSHNSFTLSNSQVISGPTEVDASAPGRMIGASQLLRMNDRGSALTTDYPATTFMVDCGIERQDQLALNSPQGRKGRIVTKLMPKIELSGYWDRTLITGLSATTRKSISIIYGSYANGGFGVFAYNCAFTDIPTPKSENDILGIDLKLEPVADPAMTDHLGNKVSDRLSPLIVCYF